MVPENLRKYTYCLGESLTSGNTKSCGCYNKDRVRQAAKERRKMNKYDLSGEYGIGWDEKGYKFIFDLEDYDSLKEFSWHLEHQNYFGASVNNSNKVLVPDGVYHIYMHKFILGVYETQNMVDHINGNTWDNRKQNLRVVDKSKNAMNSKLPTNNTSGHKGVNFFKSAGLWRAYITINCGTIYLGYFHNYEDAVIAREEAEHKYFGEYSRAPEFINNSAEVESGGD